MMPDLCKLHKICKYYKARQQVWNTLQDWYGWFPDPGIEYCSRMPVNPVEGDRTAGERPEEKDKRQTI